MRITRRQINGMANRALAERRYGFAKWLQDRVLEMVEKKVDSIELDENNPRLTEFCVQAKDTGKDIGRRTNDRTHRPKNM